MRKTILVYGGLAGLIVMPMLILLVAGKHQDGGSLLTSMLIGYTNMVLAFTMIFFGVRSYRNNRPGGTISFGRALGVGLLIAFVGSTIYVISWAILSHFFYPDFAEQLTEVYVKQQASAGVTGQKLEDYRREIESQMAMYKTWPGFTLLTYSEILPVGVLMALISAIVYSRKKKKPVAVSAA